MTLFKQTLNDSNKCPSLASVEMLPEKNSSSLTPGALSSSLHGVKSQQWPELRIASKAGSAVGSAGRHVLQWGGLGPLI